MNRSNKGFGLAGVIVTVIFLIVAAIFSASAKSSTLTEFSTDSPPETVIKLHSEI
ncbi:hypothetical protein [Paraglaciecola arctica]|uniref:Uncharacterized protein n=1 Tax=Paraglaciecola arctica BSs20135 TaxID=493475 RepID=K6YVZ4_9ALTE|nr:hypothetical protein [Paraglaciecola arctica]GAC20888.1 hypothetical protein GARC_3936 [Paraglaciecola arctica BSs20135]